VPHSPQNFVFSGFAAWQLGHFIIRPSIFPSKKGIKPKSKKQRKKQSG